MPKRKAPVDVVDLTQDLDEGAGPSNRQPAAAAGCCGAVAGAGAGAAKKKTPRKKSKKADEEKRVDAAGTTVRFAAKPNQQIRERIDRALGVGAGAAHRLFLLDRRPLAEPGAEGGGAEELAVLGATGNIYEVTICRQPQCTCPDFLKRGLPCKHILFAMLRVAGLPRDDPLVWQRAYLSSEVDAILRRLHERAGPASAPMAPEALQQRYRRLSSGGAGSSQQQRPIEGDCPICFEEMAAGGEKVSGCPGCGNHYHCGCIKRWSDSKRAAGQAVTCPLCRGSLEGEGAGGDGAKYVNLGGEGPSLDTLYGNRAVWVRANQGIISRGTAASMWNAMGADF